VRLREFKESKQKLDEIAIFGVPLWVALTGLFTGGIIQWNSLTPKQKQNTFNWFNNNIKNNKEIVQKALPLMAPGGLSNGLNTPVKIETLKDLGLKTSPATGNPATQDPYFNYGKKDKTIPPKYSTPLVQPGDSTVNKNNQNTDIKNKQPTPLVQPGDVKIKKDGTVISTTKKDEPSVWDNITNWFKDTFSSDKPEKAPVSKVDKSILAPIDSKTKKVKPGYNVPISKPVDNGDGTVTWNGQTYDKVFDKKKIAQINQSIIAQQKLRQQGQISKSVGGGSAGAVSGGKDRGKDGGVAGSGEIGELPWDGGVSGSSSKGKSIGSTGDGTITGPEIGIKGQTGVGQGAQTGTKGEVIPGTNIGTNTVTGANTIAGNPAGTIAKTFPPPYMPPPIAQLPLAKQTRKYDPKKDKGNIIYKGKVAPDAVSKFKATKSNPQKNKDYYKKLIKKFS